MPKTVINEYDLTKAGTGEYANFSVVVPGFVGADANMDVFDENGIYEVSDQNAFVQNVGKRSATIVTRKADAEAVAPKISQIIRLNTNLVQETGTKDAWYNLIEADKSDFGCDEFIYADPATYESVFNAMLLGTCPTKENPIPKVTAEEGDEVPALTEYAVYYNTINTTGYIGKLKDKDFEYIEVNAASEMADEFALVPTVEPAENPDTIVFEARARAIYPAYYVIKTGVDEAGVAYEGQNGSYVEDRITHYGNQMAYELLGLGYTVLFKKIDELDDKAFATVMKADYVIDSETGFVLEDAHGAKILKPTASAINAISELAFWECLKDKSTYDFRYLVTGLMTGNDQANTAILEVADHSEEILLDDASITDGRGDCIALIDLDCKSYSGKTQSEAIPYLAKEAAKWSSTYAACFAPYVTYIMADDPDYNNNKTFPASFHYLACAANSSNNNYSEWYANAGYTRGVSKYTIESTGCKFGEIAVQALEPRFLLKVGQEKTVDEKGMAYMKDINATVAINLIIKIKSSYYLWGNRTGKKLGTRGASDGDLVAQHFLNIRQLSTTIKKQIYVTCRRLTFDPNSNMLWINFRSLLTPMLEQMKADQGIKDYKFVKNVTDRKALLSAKVRIVPIEAVEDFDIGLYLEDSLEDVIITEG